MGDAVSKSFLPKQFEAASRVPEVGLSRFAVHDQPSYVLDAETEVLAEEG